MKNQCDDIIKHNNYKGVHEIICEAFSKITKNYRNITLQIVYVFSCFCIKNGSDQQ